MSSGGLSRLPIGQDLLAFRVRRQLRGIARRYRRQEIHFNSDKRELDLGKPLVLHFAREFLPDDRDEVRHIFSRTGAYHRYKDLLLQRGGLERWYDFSSKSEETALREWCMEKRDRTQRYLRSRCCYLPLALTKAWDMPKPAPLLSRALIHPSQNGVWSSMMRIAESRWCKVARASPRMVTSSRPL
jgi:hypothetical protein